MEAVPSVPPPEATRQEPKTYLPWSPRQTTGWDVSQRWLWQGAHREVAPLLRGRAGSSTTPACPKEQRSLAHTCWIRGLQPPARLFLTLWSPGKRCCWCAVGFLALSITLSVLSRPFCWDGPLGQLHVDAILPEGRGMLQGGKGGE